jgi:hypothetical protein
MKDMLISISLKYRLKGSLNSGSLFFVSFCQAILGEVSGNKHSWSKRKTSTGFTQNHAWFAIRSRMVFVKITLGIEQKHVWFSLEAGVVLKKVCCPQKGELHVHDFRISRVSF